MEGVEGMEGWKVWEVRKVPQVRARSLGANLGAIPADEVTWAAKTPSHFRRTPSVHDLQPSTPIRSPPPQSRAARNGGSCSTSIPQACEPVRASRDSGADTAV